MKSKRWLVGGGGVVLVILAYAFVPLPGGEDEPGCSAKCANRLPPSFCEMNVLLAVVKPEHAAKLKIRDRAVYDAERRRENRVPLTEDTYEEAVAFVKASCRAAYPARSG